MMTTIFRNKIFSAVLIAAGTLPLMASAGQPAGEHSGMKVSYSDLDLSTSKGIESLDRRLRAAAREVCGYSDLQKTDFPANIRVRQCVDRAVAKAWTRIQAKSPVA